MSLYGATAPRYDPGQTVLAYAVGLQNTEFAKPKMHKKLNYYS